MCITLSEKTSKHTSSIHRILEDQPHENSSAAYLLLKRQYALQDIDRKWKYDWRYYFISRRTFLRHKKKERGGFWVCHYCGKVIEKMENLNTAKKMKNGITIDHKVRRVEVSDPTDSTNFLECCGQCNSEKGMHSYEDYINFIGGPAEIEVLTSFNLLDFLLLKLMVMFNYK